MSSLGELLYPERKTTESSDVELTEEEKAAVLEEARQKKERLVRHEEQQDRRRRWEEEMRRPWGPVEMGIYIKWKAEQKGIPLVTDDHNREVLIALCRYFTGHEAFEQMQDGWSLNKGIMLCGPVGTGKTTLMSLFRANQRQSFKMISCRELADRFADQGHEMLHTFSHPLQVPNHSDTFWQTEIGVCFDDLGTENSKKNYGNQVNVMENILSNRYDMGSMPYHLTHVTTNLSSSEIEDYYGTRVRSRMREMFNMITLAGSDRRK